MPNVMNNGMSMWNSICGVSVLGHSIMVGQRTFQRLHTIENHVVFTNSKNFSRM